MAHLRMEKAVDGLVLEHKTDSNSSSDSHISKRTILDPDRQQIRSVRAFSSLEIKKKKKVRVVAVSKFASGSGIDVGVDETRSRRKVRTDEGEDRSVLPARFGSAGDVAERGTGAVEVERSETRNADCIKLSSFLLFLLLHPLHALFQSLFRLVRRCKLC